MQIFNRENIIFINEKGREIVFDPHVSGNTIVNRTEKLTLTRGDGRYEIFNDKTRQRYIFKGKPENAAYKLAEIEDETGKHRIVLEYYKNIYLRGITDTAGRYFEITTNETGQITSVKYDDRVLVQYAYDDKQNLIEVTDVNGVKAKLCYDNHLLVKRITKFGDAFEWEYDGTDDKAKCTNNWGTGGLLECWFEYNDDHTVFTNSLKNKSYYYFDEKKRLTRYIDANNAETIYEYNEYGEVVSVTAPDGEITKFAYDSAGKITELTYPNGGKQTYEYDWQSRPIKMTAPNGAETQWGRDAKGRLIKVTIPTGVEILYTYDKNGMVSRIIEGAGENERVTEYGYDDELNLIEIKYPNGGTKTREYDKHGNCVKAVNPLGAAEIMEYDRANNLVKHTAIDGNVTQLSYNAYGDLILFKDNDREVSYAYTPLRYLASRKEQNRIVNLVYDTECKLSYVENEAREKYVFERDGAGRIISETGYDNVTKSYKYSPGSKLTGIKRGETSGWTEMKYGADGQLAEIQYDNGETEMFVYGKMGELLAAENKNSKLEFEYDIIGRLIKETQNGYVIESKYSGEYIRSGRVALNTSLGLNVDINLNQFGQAEEINAGFQGGFQYQSNLSYNLIGQETQRAIKTAGGGSIVDTWDYDKLGRPVSQCTRVNDRESRRRQ
jgi:YD repeat-containing protein